MTLGKGGFDPLLYPFWVLKWLFSRLLGEARCLRTPGCCLAHPVSVRRPQKGQAEAPERSGGAEVAELEAEIRDLKAQCQRAEVCLGSTWPLLSAAVRLPRSRWDGIVCSMREGLGIETGGLSGLLGMHRGVGVGGAWRTHMGPIEGHGG